MKTHSSDSSGGPRALLEACREFSGPAPEFWLKFANACGVLFQAKWVQMTVRQEGAWRLLSNWPEDNRPRMPLSEEQFHELQAAALSTGQAFAELKGYSAGLLLAIALRSGEGAPPALAIILIDQEPDYGWANWERLVPFVADLPGTYQRNVEFRRTRENLEHFENALDILAAVNAETHFTPAAMALVNESASRLEASRATLGWVRDHYIRVVAMSGTEKFERKVQAIQSLEAAMEECRDQDEEITVPALLQSDCIARDHEQYLKVASVSALMSVPFRVEDKVVAVLTMERESAPFSERDLSGLRVIADQTGRRLADLKAASRWFGARWYFGLRRQLGKLVGPRHTWLKVGAIAGVLFLAFAIFFKYPYRVETTFVVRPSSQAFLPVPFSGFIASAPFRPGDEVTTGQTLIELDQGELRVSEAAALAEIRRYRAEAERAQAEGRLADYRVARVMAAQAEADLDLARYRLARAEIRAPFDGIIIEGDLRERLGSPVEQGDILMSVSRLDGLYLQIKLPERDIDLLDGSGKGLVAFAVRPDLRFPFDIERIDPAARPDEDGNFFNVRAHLEEDPDWLRPGMTGVAKLDGGNRSLLWRATHRVIDFFRMRLWI